MCPALELLTKPNTTERPYPALIFPKSAPAMSVEEIEALEARLSGQSPDLNVSYADWPVVELEQTVKKQALVDLINFVKVAKSKKAQVACLALHRIFVTFHKQGRLSKTNGKGDAAALQVQDWLLGRYNEYVQLLAVALSTSSSIPSVSLETASTSRHSRIVADSSTSNFDGSGQERERSSDSLCCA